MIIQYISIKLTFKIKNELSLWIAEADIVLLAVPGFLGYQSLKTIINCGKDVVDISFSPENVLTLDQLAKEKKCYRSCRCGRCSRNSEFSF